MKVTRLFAILLALFSSSAHAGLFTNLALTSAVALAVKGESVKCQASNSPDCESYRKAANKVAAAKQRTGNAIKALKGQ